MRGGRGAWGLGREGRCGILGRGNIGSWEGQGFYFSPSSCMLTTYSYTNALK